MTRDEAFQALANASAHSRFEAVRTLESLALSSDVAYLLKAKSKETDFYVNKRLQMLIEKISREPASQPNEEEEYKIPFELQLKIKSEAIEWVSGLLLHEIGSKLGLLAGAIEHEVPNYQDSTAKRRIESLQDTFDGIEQLKKATSTPRPVEMDLANFIDELVSLETENFEIDHYLLGRKPLVIFCDRSLLTLALCNGVKNAIEASILVADHRRPVITLSWGITDRDYWITVTDSGPGVLESAGSFKLGESSKPGHLGFGLGIAKQAMETLRGSVSLQNSGGGGTVYELRWSLSI
ncbi:ATP-binding protein [Pseudomonas brassicacearum]|uniref:ATP-binding protein n=1 Tax=Pseudomonas brassicacearum TaxID=930166 RepID=UPI000879BCDF|nr:ATP-binding protein [Pseudomonas brassicacearum]KAB0526893.1 ATP-binding protein [Pseudomonas brassicacearum subsp. brassicacearum]NJP60564.1 ATP-binding protein [Pseudomonas brassicacearum]SDP88850.1 Signal transduction histidine kinase [Pseudomonas brassicacearum]